MVSGSSSGAARRHRPPAGAAPAGPKARRVPAWAQRRPPGRGRARPRGTAATRVAAREGGWTWPEGLLSGEDGRGDELGGRALAGERLHELHERHLLLIGEVEALDAG